MEIWIKLCWDVLAKKMMQKSAVVFALAEEGLLAILQEDVKTAMNAVNGKKVGE